MELGTKYKMTWCPGCPNHMILESSKRAFNDLIKKGYKKDDFVIVTGIGCHGKIFDYLDLSGFYGLHGRSLPTAFGIKIGNPNLKVVCYAGDGDTYSEGMEHFIHACRNNADMTLIVHDNQSFSLTTGQTTPTSQLGFKSKIEPNGNEIHPLNPVKLALVSGATFVARCDARDIEHTAKIIKEAVEHKGFAFVEILQTCLIFNPSLDHVREFMYKTENGSNIVKAMKLADQWDYAFRHGRIPIGVLYKHTRQTYEEKHDALVNLINKKKSWKEYAKK